MAALTASLINSFFPLVIFTRLSVPAIYGLAYYPVDGRQQ